MKNTMLKIFLKIFSLSLTKHRGAEGIEASGVKSNACECPLMPSISET